MTKPNSSKKVPTNIKKLIYSTIWSTGKIQEEIHTFCISALDIKEWDTFSRLSCKTSVIAAVITSACFDGIPWASNFLTLSHKQKIKNQNQSKLNHWINQTNKKW